MQYKIVITEKTSAELIINARSVTDALSKAKRLYYDDKIAVENLAGVEFVADLGENTAVKTEVKQ